MTSFGGSGGGDIGNVRAKVKIEYESSSAKAVKDVTALRDSLVSAGSAADQTGKQIAKAQKQLSGMKVSAPLTLSPKDVQLDMASISKAVAHIKSYNKRIVISAPIKIVATDIELDVGSVTGAIEKFTKTLPLQKLSISAPIKVIASEVMIDRGAIESAVSSANFGTLTVTAPVILDPSDVTVRDSAIKNAISQIQAPMQGGGGGGGAGALLGGMLGGRMMGGMRGGAMLGMLGKFAAPIAGIFSVGTVLQQGFSRLQGIDQATTKLKALGKTEKEIQSVSKLALESVLDTAFGLDEAFSAATDAIAAGIKPGKELNEYMSALTSTAALANVSMLDLGRAFNQAAVQGRLTGDVLLMLYDRQVPVIQLLAEEYGVTQAKAREMVTNGEVDFNRFIAAMNKNKEAAKIMGNTVSGSFNNLMASVKRVGASLLAPLFTQDAEGITTLARGIQAITQKLKEFEGFLSQHKEAIIDFWAAVAEGGIMAASAIQHVIGWILEGVGKLIEGIGHIPSAFAGIIEFFGGEGVARNLRQASDNMTNWGQSIFKAGQSTFKFNEWADQALRGIDEWKNKSKEAARSAGAVGDGAEGAAPQVKTLAEALETLGFKADKATAAIEGSGTEYRKLLDELEKKGASEDVIRMVQELRDQWLNGGYAIKSFADAIDNFADKTKSADDRAQAFIRSLQELQLIPDDSALSRYNEDLEETIGYQSKLVDMLGVTGNALVLANGQIDVNTKNGRTLSSTISKVIQDSTALVASGAASPEEAYGRSTQWITELLRRFGITDPTTVQAVLAKYFPPNLFIEALKRAGDPKSAIEQAFKNDPAKLQAELNLLTSTKDIINQLVDKDGKLHVPTVLDVTRPGAAGGGGTNTPPGGGGNNEPPVNKPPPAANGSEIPIPGLTIPGQTPSPIPTLPGYTVPIPGMSGYVDPTSVLQSVPPGTLSKSVTDLLNNPAMLTSILASHPDIADLLRPTIEKAQAQGKSFVEAFAEGIKSNDPAILEAIKKLAGLAGDGLGSSPARYGPLSGTGWTYYRGQSFTQAWAEGIASQSNTVRSASTGIAYAAVAPFDAKWTQTIKDLQEFSEFGRHIYEFMNSLVGIGLSVGQLINTISFGRAFPKSYRKDPTRLPSGSPLGSWNPKGWNPSGGPIQAGQVRALGPSPGQQDVANYIIDKAMSLGYSREQANWFVQQAYGESHLSPTAYNKAGWSGIFQFDVPTWEGVGGGDVMNAQQNIDNYFRLAAQRGINPGNLSQGMLLGTQVSIGGPWHPQNARKGHLSAALAGAQPFIEAYQAAMGGGAPGAAGTLPVLHDTGAVPSGAQAVTAAAYVARLFPGVKYIGGSRPAGAGTAKNTHDIGRAIDISIPQTPEGMAMGDQINAWLQQNSKLLGIVYTIWRDKGLQTGLGGKKAGETFTATGHYDHIDVQFDGGSTVSINGPGVNFNVPQAPPPQAPGPTTPGPAPAPGPANWMPVQDKDGNTWYYLKTPETDMGGYKYPPEARWVPPGIDVSSVKFDKNGLPYSEEYSWGKGGVLRKPNTEDVLTPPEEPKEFKPEPLPTAPGAPTGTPQNPVNVTLPPGLSGPLTQIPPALQQLGDEWLNRALGGGITNEQDAITALQHIDSLIAQQNLLRTPESRATIDALNQIHSGLQEQFGLEQGPSALEEAQNIASGVAGIVGDVFGVFDQSLRSVAATKDITGTLVRGVANTEDIYNMVDKVQEYISLAARVATLAGDIMQVTGGIIQGAGAAAGASGGDMGGTMAAGMALSAAGSAAQIASQVMAAVNAAIDLGQEAYKISTKYLGRFLTSWFGFPGANDIKYLLDTVTGELKTYTSENPDLKHTFNTFGKETGLVNYGSRPSAYNYFTIYQGPGQDPRDTMDDAMFSVRSSGVGVFGYGD